jgi:hypothetical protein
VGLLAGVSLTGCYSTGPVPRRQSGYIVGSQGAGSEVVFPSVQVAAAGAVEGFEYARRDDSLNIRGIETAFDYDSWPAAPSPSLYQFRRLSLPTSATQVLYFDNGGNRCRSWPAPCPFWP